MASPSALTDMTMPKGILRPTLRPIRPVFRISIRKQKNKPKKEHMNLKQLPALLKKKNWSYQKLAKASGVPKSTIHGWVSGQTAVSLEQLKAVAECLEVSVHSLAFGTPDPYEDSSSEVLEKIFSGDIRVTLHRIDRKKK